MILACAASAGIHGALTPAHVAEGRAAGIGFAASAAVLALLAVAITRYPNAEPLLTFAALTLAALIVSWAFATTTGLPLLHPEPEPVDGLALVTKAIELSGLVAVALFHPSANERNPRWKRHVYNARSHSS